MPKSINKAAKIRQLLKDGVSVADIAKRSRVSPNYVYQVRYKANGTAFKAKKKVTAKKEATVRDFVVAAKAEGMNVKFDIVPNEPPAAPSAFDTQEGGGHYIGMAIQPAAFCHKNGIGKLEGDVIYYVARWRMNGGVGDLQKARHTLDLMLQLEQAA